jgi:iron complex outermembrane receptor protein
MRSERRIEDTPLRVAVFDRDEVEEKLLMTPSEISTMPNETGGLRVQATNPSLGGANVLSKDCAAATRRSSRMVCR